MILYSECFPVSCFIEKVNHRTGFYDVILTYEHATCASHFSCAMHFFEDVKIHNAMLRMRSKRCTKNLFSLAYICIIKSQSTILDKILFALTLKNNQRYVCVAYVIIVIG